MRPKSLFIAGGAMGKIQMKSFFGFLGTLFLVASLFVGTACSKDVAKKEDAASGSPGGVSCKSFATSNYFMSFSACEDKKFRAVLCSEIEGKFPCACKLGDEIQKKFELSEAPFDSNAELSEQKMKAKELAKTQCGFHIL